MNFDSDCIEEYESLVAALDWGDVWFKPKIYELDMKNRESPPTKSSIEEAPKVELKALPRHLRYEFLGNGDTLPVIIASDLDEKQVQSLVKVLKRFKRAIGWTIADIIGSLLVFALIKSNSCLIISRVLSSRDAWILLCKRLWRRKLSSGWMLE